MSDLDKRKVKGEMLSLAHLLGEFLENQFFSFRNIHDKDNISLEIGPLKEAESIAKRIINNKFPDHKIYSRCLEDDFDTYNWVINPLDGYNHFMRNIPIYIISLALRYGGETLMGVVYYPSAKQLFFAAKGQGAYLNGLPIKVSSTDELSKSYIFVELPEQKFVSQEDIANVFDQRIEMTKKLIKECKQVETFRIGALAQCLVAVGAFDGYLDLSSSSKIWNQYASKLIVEEADGKIKEIESVKEDFLSLAVSNKFLIDKLSEI